MQHLIFDLDGTISNPQKGIINAYKFAFKHMQISVSEDEDLIQFIGPPLREVFGEHYGLNEEQSALAIKAYRHYYIEQEGMFENDLFPGMYELLHDLKQAGKHLYIATFKGASVDTILKHFGILHLFDSIEFYNETSGVVSKEQMIASILQRHSIAEKQDTIMIGDRKHDILAAHHTGILSCSVRYGFGTNEELDACNPTFSATDASSLRQLLLS